MGQLGVFLTLVLPERRAARRAEHAGIVARAPGVQVLPRANYLAALERPAVAAVDVALGHRSVAGQRAHPDLGVDVKVI